MKYNGLFICESDSLTDKKKVEKQLKELGVFLIEYKQGSQIPQYIPIMQENSVGAIGFEVNSNKDEGKNGEDVYC